MTVFINANKTESKMSKISDIKLFQSDNGRLGSLQAFGQINEKQYALITRLTLKLREMSFRFAQNFSWLIVVFTPSLKNNQIEILGRVGGDSFCQVNVGADFSQKMSDEQLIGIVKKILIMLTDESNEFIIQRAIDYVVSHKDKSRALYKRRKVGKYEVLFYIIVNNDNSETRIARIVDSNGNLTKEVAIPFLLDFIGKVYLKNGTIHITDKRFENEENSIIVPIV